MNKDIVISTWGFGPTYRNRIKFQIEEAIKSGYNPLMKYIILTDHINDFVGLDQSMRDMIVDVVDIEDLRKDDDFSLKFEPLPEEKVDDYEYAKQLRYNSDERKLLPSYGLQRYNLKTLSKLGISKSLFIDSDVEIPYNRLVSGQISEETYWNVFDTPDNSIKGSGYEVIKFGRIDDQQKMEFIYGKTIGSTDSTRVLQACSIVTYKYYEERGELDRWNILEKLATLEGCIRYYNFESTEKLDAFFNSYNSIYSLFLEQPRLYDVNRCGNYMLCDVIPLALASQINDIELLHFPGSLYQLRVFFQDRFWGPPWHFDPDCNGRGVNLLPAKTLEEFLKINEELIGCMRKRNQWPSVSYSVC